ncbi:hypothetical protein KC959_02255 [Candidatus Saccharibacteria bacterium]|nr:hypothetical protein [Candidatus Saccharibacteria bacterium]
MAINVSELTPSDSQKGNDLNRSSSAGHGLVTRLSVVRQDSLVVPDLGPGNNDDRGGTELSSDLSQDSQHAPLTFAASALSKVLPEGLRDRRLTTLQRVKTVGRTRSHGALYPVVSTNPMNNAQELAKLNRRMAAVEPKTRRLRIN